MKVIALHSEIINIPYRRPEESSRVHRSGVTAVLVRVETDTGIIGWGESCVGPDAGSVAEVVESACPLVVGEDPWNSEHITHRLYHVGMWDRRPMTANFAFAGIDMALRDICGKASGQPLYRLFGGAMRPSVDYFYYLAHGSSSEITAQARDGLSRGYRVFYLKVGIDIESELETVRVLREYVGSRAKIRIDANGAWSPGEALRNLYALDRYTIDFAEQPVAPYPVRNMAELRARTHVPICANEGLAQVAEVWEVIRARAADILNFSPYWVGTLAHFHRLSHAAHLEGLLVCKHTHGETGIAASACHHVCLTLPNLTDGNQQVASILEDDVLVESLPIREGPSWGVPTKPGIGIEVDVEKVAKYAKLYERIGQFLPYSADGPYNDSPEKTVGERMDDK